jgi:predicted nucleic acid-binding protein
VTLVLDASAVVAALVDDGEVGRWAEAAIGRDDLAAPHLMTFEAANILRRASQRGELSEDVARLAHADLLDLTVDLADYEVLAERAWELRGSVTVYDAAYIALAEMLEAPMMTLDLRLSRAPGPRCAFWTPSDPSPR